jgi:hypothetical protein
MVYKDLSLGERQFFETLSVLHRAGIIKPILTNPGQFPKKFSYALVKVGRPKQKDAGSGESKEAPG